MPKTTKKKIVVNLEINLYMTIDQPDDKEFHDVMDDIMANLDYDFSLIREADDVAEIDDMEIVDWDSRPDRTQKE